MVLVTIIMVQNLSGCLILVHTLHGFSDHNNGAEFKWLPYFSMRAVHGYNDHNQGAEYMWLPYFSTRAVVLVTIIMVQNVSGCLILVHTLWF